MSVNCITDTTISPARWLAYLVLHLSITYLIKYLIFCMNIYQINMEATTFLLTLHNEDLSESLQCHSLETTSE